MFSVMLEGAVGVSKAMLRWGVGFRARDGICDRSGCNGRNRPEAGLSFIVTPDLIRGPRLRQCGGSRIKSGMMNDRIRPLCALRSSLWRSHGEVAARSADGGAIPPPLRPLHHRLRRRSPSPSLRDREDRSIIVTPDLIRDPPRRRSRGPRIKSGVTNEDQRTTAPHPKAAVGAHHAQYGASPECESPTRRRFVSTRLDAIGEPCNFIDELK